MRIRLDIELDNRETCHCEMDIETNDLTYIVYKVEGSGVPTVRPIGGDKVTLTEKMAVSPYITQLLGNIIDKAFETQLRETTHVKASPATFQTKVEK